jgi:hypothetical protein
MDPFLSQMNPVHILITCFSKLNINIIFPSVVSLNGLLLSVFVNNTLNAYLLHDMISSFRDWLLYDMSTAVLSAPLLGGSEVEFPIPFHSCNFQHLEVRLCAIYLCELNFIRKLLTCCETSCSSH